MSRKLWRKNLLIFHFSSFFFSCFLFRVFPFQFFTLIFELLIPCVSQNKINSQPWILVWYLPRLQNKYPTWRAWHPSFIELFSFFVFGGINMKYFALAITLQFLIPGTSDSHRITKYFALEGILRIIQFHPSSLGREPLSKSSYSKSHLISLGHFQKWGIHSSWTTCSSVYSASL